MGKAAGESFKHAVSVYVILANYLNRGSGREKKVVDRVFSSSTSTCLSLLHDQNSQGVKLSLPLVRDADFGEDTEDIQDDIQGTIANTTVMNDKSRIFKERYDGSPPKGQNLSS